MVSLTTSFRAKKQQLSGTIIIIMGSQIMVSYKTKGKRQLNFLSYMIILGFGRYILIFLCAWVTSPIVCIVYLSLISIHNCQALCSAKIHNIFVVTWWSYTFLEFPYTIVRLYVLQRYIAMCKCGVLIET